jgi:hypothetical protein
MDPVLLADVVVTVHMLFMLFVVFAQVLIVAGWLLRWGWVRSFWFRLIHLASIGIVAAQAVAGIICPLTTLERHLRREAAYPTYCALLAGNLVASRSENLQTTLVSATWACNPISVINDAGPLHILERASAIGRFCNQTLFFRDPPKYLFPIIYVTFATMVVLTWVFALPRLPWRKPAPARGEQESAKGKNDRGSPEEASAG